MARRLRFWPSALKHGLLALVLLVAAAAVGQTDAITLQVTDGDGQTWNNGTWQLNGLVAPQSAPAGPYYIAGTASVVPNQFQSGSLSATGGATFMVTTNANIAPAGTTWSLTVCPLATSACQTVGFTATGSTQTVNVNPVAIRINLTGVPYRVLAYQDLEVNNGSIGSLYYNITLAAYRTCGSLVCSNGTGWSSISGFGSAPKVYYATSNGLACNGSTDDTTALQSLLNTAAAAGPSVIKFAPGQTCKFSSARITIPINADSWPDGGGTVSTMNPMRWTCDAGVPDFQGMSSGALVTQLPLGCTLDFEYNDPVAKIFAGGMGKLEIDHLAFVDLASNDCSPNTPAFLLDTNSTIYFHDNAVIGNLEVFPDPTPILSLVSGTSPGTIVYVRVAYTGPRETGFAVNTLSNATPSTSQQVQVTSPINFGQATGYNVYASATSGGTYYLQNTGGPTALGTNYTIPGTLVTSGTTAPANSSAYSCNDVVILGGTTTTPSSTSTSAPFQGYGTVIENNSVDAIGRLVLAQTYANSYKVIYNKVWQEGGMAGNHGPIENVPQVTSLASGGAVIIGNVMETTHYQYGIFFNSATSPSVGMIAQNDCYDSAEFSTYCYYSTSGGVSPGNFVFGGYTGTGYNLSPSDSWSDFLGNDLDWGRSGKNVFRIDDMMLMDPGGHFRTAAPIGDTATDTAPICTMSSGTCSYSFTVSWSVAPRCTGSWTGTGTFTTGASLKITATTSAVSATSSTGTDSAQIAMICVGAPR